jgi:hypothetical protein
MIEAVGYLGSALVVVSLLMTRILRLRVIGLMGSTTFLIYGLLIGSVPIIITNAVIIIINVTFLWRATHVKEWFYLLEIHPESLYLEEFLRFYQEDILKYQPEWNGEVADSDLTVLVLRDMQPAMAIVGTVGPDAMDLRLDYAIPRFHDYRMGRFLYDANASFFAERNITTIAASVHTKQHARYLEKMGFVETETGHYERSLIEQPSQS